MADGEQALALLRGGGQPPDLVLLDLNLPRCDGREVLEAIKRDPELLTIPVIVLSTSSSLREIAARYALHANAYLVKPLGFELSGRSADVTASVGVAIARPGDETAAELLQRADAAMYEAKRSGRGRCSLSAAG